MRPESLGEVIATRILFLANDPNHKIVVRMGKPQPMPDALGDDHYCPYQITGLGSEKLKCAAGVDTFQSLELGFRMIGSDLAFLNSQSDGQLRWECDDHGGLGFPIPKVFQK